MPRITSEFRIVIGAGVPALIAEGILAREAREQDGVYEVALRRSLAGRDMDAKWRHRLSGAATENGLATGWVLFSKRHLSPAWMVMWFNCDVRGLNMDPRYPSGPMAKKCVLGLALILTTFWVGLLAYILLALIGGGFVGIRNAIWHLVSNPLKGPPPSLGALIAALSAYALVTIKLWLLYLRWSRRQR